MVLYYVKRFYFELKIGVEFLFTSQILKTLPNSLYNGTLIGLQVHGLGQ